MDHSSARKASIKETGEEISPEDWARFDAAVDEVREEQARRNEDRVVGVNETQADPR